MQQKAMESMGGPGGPGGGMRGTGGPGGRSFNPLDQLKGEDGKVDLSKIDSNSPFLQQLKEFDKNNDGYLDADEQNALQEQFQNMFRNRNGRGGYGGFQRCRYALFSDPSVKNQENVFALFSLHPCSASKRHREGDPVDGPARVSHDLDGKCLLCGPRASHGSGRRRVPGRDRRREKGQYAGALHDQGRHTGRAAADRVQLCARKL